MRACTDGTTHDADTARTAVEPAGDGPLLNPTALIGRLEEWATTRRLRILGRNPASFTLHVVRRFIDVRVTGLAAEMTYYTVLSLLPLLTAFAAALGALEGLIGTQAVRDIEDGVVEGVRGVLSDQLTEDVVAPLVRELLSQQRTGVAISGLLVTVWLAGRVFRAAIRALDDAYGVDERRTLLQQWGLSVVFLLGAVLVGVVSLAMFVVGPLLGGGRQVAEWAGLGSAWEALWDLGRWPLMAALGVGFLMLLYLRGPNVQNTWRECLPGAVVATVALALVAIGFQLYLATVGPTTPEIDARQEAVDVAASLLGTLAAVLLFLWLSNMCMLLGGVVNAEWANDDGEVRTDPIEPPRPRS